MAPYIMDDVKENEYSHPILELELRENVGLQENDFVKAARKKYWYALFKDHRFTGKMTSNLKDEYMRMISKLVDYDFSSFNILQIQLDIAKKLSRGVEECIIELFDKLSCQHSYNDEYSKNVHYYNGWKTNKSWIVNKKVIIPFYGAFSQYGSKSLDVWECSRKLNDIEKALDYLDTGKTTSVDIYSRLKLAESTGNTRNIWLKHFTVTIYKKGTCHITFHDDELLKKFNIFGSQKKRWLPQHYGRKAYNEFTAEEQSVIDSFQGKEEYEKVFRNPEQWIFDPVKAIPLLETAN